MKLADSTREIATVVAKTWKLGKVRWKEFACLADCWSSSYGIKLRCNPGGSL